MRSGGGQKEKEKESSGGRRVFIRSWARAGNRNRHRQISRFLRKCVVENAEMQ